MGRGVQSRCPLLLSGHFYKPHLRGSRRRDFPWGCRSPLGSRLTLKRPRGGRAAKLALTRGTPSTSMVESPSWHSKRRRVQWHCPRASGPRTEQRAPTLEPSNKERAPTQEPALSQRNVFRPLVSGFRPGLAGCAGSFLGALFPRPGSGLFLSVFVPSPVSFHWPRASRFQLPEGGTSGQTQGHPPKNWYWAPTQGPALAGTPLDVRCSWTLVPCIRSHESAGHMVVCVVTGQMVGDRRSPRATILGVGTIYLLRQSLLSCPVDRFRTS